MVLLIEDYANLAREIAAYLVAEGWRVHTTNDGVEGLRLVLEQPWSIILLDLSLPGVDGTVICQTLREAGDDTPIIMITARGLRRDVVGGLDCGADDYLVKPFGLDELVARMRALMRRTGTTREPVLRVGEVTIDSNTHRVEVDGTEVRLAPREYALLEHLARHRGVPQNRLELIEQVWGEPGDLMFSQTVDVHVAYIRRKLGRDVIRTVRGLGYMVPDE
ncbi:MAG: response regulator transcription factor [Actinomycetota bacterium]|nr:MAG: Two-component response [Actinomycetota bacterium]MDO8949459.1 response regulator transcription factor [Actinomycetota bacterium]MDP3631247.1 response regulator transcription factor [Actinomycetota bacterium]